jgi:hypothetical protein
MKNLAMVLTIILAIVFSTGSTGAQAPGSIDDVPKTEGLDVL